MRKKILSLCMVLALCLGLLPTTALAADGDTVYVGGVALEGSTDSPAYATTDDSGTVITGSASESDYNIKWDGSTLTLDGAKIKGGTSSESLYATVGIYAFSNSGDVSLNIALKGVNEIFDSSHGIWVYSPSTNAGNVTLTIEGEGSLNASGSSSGILVQSNSGDATLTIQNADVTAENSISSGDGVTVRAGSRSSASLSVDGGSLTATGKNENGAGIRYTFGSSSSGSGNPSLNVSGNTIVRANGGISDNSSTDIQIGGDNNSSGGIVFDGNEGTVYGSVTLQEDLTIGEGESLTIPEGSSLTVPEEKTITVESGGNLEGTPTGSGTVKIAPTITTESLPGGTVGEPYTETILAATGDASITWSVSNGSLPAGLSLSEDGKITGTPTTAGTSTFTVKAENNAGSDSEKYTINIAAKSDTTPPTLTAGTVNRTSDTEATVTFTSDEAGTYFYKVVDSGAEAPTNIVSGTSTDMAIGENTINLTNLTAGAKDIYIVAKDAAGNVSDSTFKIEIPAYVAPSYSISIDPTSLDFGSVNVGYATAPAAKTVTITNTGNQTFTLTQPTATNFDIGTLSATELAAGATATFTVQPKTGLAAGSYNETLAISGDNDVGATVGLSFTVNPKLYTVTVLTDGKGSASASPATAAAGTTVTLTAKPDSGYRLAHWEVVEGDVTISGNSFTMPAENVTVRAVFSPVVNIPDTHSIDLIVSDGGEAKLSLTNASAGSTITVTATPDEGFKLDYITVDGERIDGTTFTMPAHDVTVRVYFTDGAALPFTDVSAGAWYFDAVGYVYVGGLMDGVSDTLFDPDGTMTRAMVWAILARVDGETVTGEDWIETAREWAVANGVSDGENATDYVTREQLATMLWRYAVYKGYDVSVGEDTNILSYVDFADLSEYAIPAMQWACGAGVITGVTDATLVPQGEATRAQVAAMLMRFVEAIG